MLSSIYFFALYNIFLCSTSLCFCVQKDFYNVHVYTDAFFFFFFRKTFHVLHFQAFLCVFDNSSIRILLKIFVFFYMFEN